MRFTSLLQQTIAILLVIFSLAAGAGEAKSGTWEGLKQMMSARELNVFMRESLFQLS